MKPKITPVVFKSQSEVVPKRNKNLFPDMTYHVGAHFIGCDFIALRGHTFQISTVEHQYYTLLTATVNH